MKRKRIWRLEDEPRIQWERFWRLFRARLAGACAQGMNLCRTSQGLQTFWALAYAIDSTTATAPAGAQPRSETHDGIARHQHQDFGELQAGRQPQS